MDKYNCFATYIKPDVQTELANFNRLKDTFFIFKGDTQLTGQPMSQLNTLTPSRCYGLCKTDATCGAASFTTNGKERYNCFLYQPGTFRENGEFNDLWGSFINAEVLATTTTEIATTTTSVAATAVVSPFALEENANLPGEYAGYKSTSESFCFQLCDADPKCAISFFTAEFGECRFFNTNYEKTMTYSKSKSVCHFKPERLKENPEFTNIKQNTRISGTYEFTTNTLSKCFKSCRDSEDCAAATFSMKIESKSGCFHFKTDFSESTSLESDDRFWVSYVKIISEEIKPTPAAAVSKSPAAADSPRQKVLFNTRLSGQEKQLQFDTASDCFNNCELNPECAGACFKSGGGQRPSQCLVFKYGFVRRYPSLGWSGFIKPLVSEDMANIDKLTEKFPIVKLDTRFTKSFDQFNTLTPSQCFHACKQSVRCAAASFSKNSNWSDNCLIFKRGVYEESDMEVEHWISYVKETSSAAMQAEIS
jgi:hypothetical protein